MWDVGDTYPMTVEVRDAAGQLVDPVSIAAEVRLPDGTVAAPTLAHPSVGRYTHDLVLTQYGLHRWRALSSGPSTAYADIVNVANPWGASVIGLSEAKHYLNIPIASTHHDEELRGFIASASEVVEGIVGPVARRTVTETVTGGGTALLLTHRPVLAVTSVVDAGGAPVDAGAYRVDPAGILTRRYGRWAYGPWTVTFEAGRTAVPASVQHGVAELLRINWRPQQGGSYSPFEGGRGDVLSQPVGADVRLGFWVPRTVMERLQPHGRGPHIA